MIEREDIHLLIQALADGELDAAAALEVERRIAEDPGLARRYDAVVAVKKATGDLPRPVVSDAFKARIARLAPGRVAGVSEAAEPPRRSDWRALAASVLLSAVLASGATYLMTAPLPDDNLAAALAGSHRRSLLAASPVDIASSDRHAVKPWLDARIGLSPPAVDMADKGFVLLGGRVEVIADRAVPSLVYRHNEHLITLVAIPTAQGAGQTPEHLATSGFGMARWRGEGYTYWAISDMERAELDVFVTEFRSRVARQ